MLKVILVLTDTEDEVRFLNLPLPRLAFNIFGKRLAKKRTECLECLCPGSLLYSLKGNKKAVETQKDTGLEVRKSFLMTTILWGLLICSANLSPEVLPEPSNLFSFTKCHFLSIYKSPHSQIFFSFFFCLFRATPRAYGSSQARG